MKKHATWWAVVALVLALAGAAHAKSVDIGGVEDGHGGEVRIYRMSDSKRVGVLVAFNGAPNVVHMDKEPATRLATLIQQAWSSRGTCPVKGSRLIGSVDGFHGSVYVAVGRVTSDKVAAVVVTVTSRDSENRHVVLGRADQVQRVATLLRTAAR